MPGGERHGIKDRVLNAREINNIEAENEALVNRE